MLLPFNTHKDKAMMGGTWIVHSEKLSSDAGFLLFYAVSLLQILLERNHYFSIDKQRIARSFWQHCVPYTFSKRGGENLHYFIVLRMGFTRRTFCDISKKKSFNFFLLSVSFQLPLLWNWKSFLLASFLLTTLWN